jgi:CRP-like cAMP-binding protein
MFNIAHQPKLRAHIASILPADRPTLDPPEGIQAVESPPMNHLHQPFDWFIFLDEGTGWKMKPNKTPRRPPFNLKDFLAKANGGRTITAYRANDHIFAQGETADAIFYIKQGKVRLTVVSKQGKEAVIAILGDGDFFGEGCLAGQQVRMATAIAVTECSVIKLEKAVVVGLLHKESSFSDLFMSHLLSRNIKIEEDLVDQLFNSSEKRLARVLLLLANFGQASASQTAIPKISQETLAGIVGTTRSRVNFFMNRFRKLGFIDYNGGLKVHNSLLNVVLHD